MPELGDDHSCAVKWDGTAWCWGEGWDYRLGNGSTTDRYWPYEVANGWTDWVKLTAGGEHTCGVRETGALYCWGEGASGRLGYGGTADRTTPYLVSGGYSWADVSAGYLHSCGVRTDGATMCWGYNTQGQLGTGDTTYYYTPQALTTTVMSRPVEFVAGGYYHTCALDQDRATFCWGANFDGQVGNNTAEFHYEPAVATYMGDTDGDGLFDTDEIAIGTFLLYTDTDADGVADGIEWFINGTDPLDPADY